MDWLVVCLGLSIWLLLVVPYAVVVWLLPIPELLHLCFMLHAIALVLYMRWVPLESVQFRSIRLWEWLRTRYFGYTVHDAHNTLGDSTQTIFAMHPHGVYATSTIFYFALNPSLLHVKPVGTSLLFNLPLVKEFVGLAGTIRANRQDILSTLQCGDSVVLCPGGLRELLHPLVKRQGFLKIAMATGVRVVPVHSPQENDLYTVWMVWPWLQGWLLSLFLYPFPVLSWGAWWLPFWPKHVGKMHLHFGKPLHPGDYKSVSDMEEAFYKQLKELG